MKLVVDSREAYAYTGGRPFDGARPCIVFVHGALHDHSVWTLLARWFAHHGHAVLAPDLPGHMRSAGPPLASVEAMAAWLLRLLDAAGVAEAALVGHSMGSLVALDAAGQAPQRVRRLALVGTAVPMTVSPALLEASLKTPGRAIDMTTTFSFSSWASKPSFPSPGAWLHGSGRALNQVVLRHQGRDDLFHVDFSACNGYLGALDAAARVACPTTLLLGERDQMTPPKAAAELAAALQARVPTEVVRLPGGHLPMAEAPDELLRALRRALGEPGGGR